MTTHVVGPTMHRKFAHGEDLRQQADICRGLAGIARTERNRLFWLRLAGEWAELATTAEHHETRRGVPGRGSIGAADSSSAF
jgi:gluconate kinase